MNESAQPPTLPERLARQLRLPTEDAERLLAELTPQERSELTPLARREGAAWARELVWRLTDYRQRRIRLRAETERLAAHAWAAQALRRIAE